MGAGTLKDTRKPPCRKGSGRWPREGLPGGGHVRCVPSVRWESLSFPWTAEDTEAEEHCGAHVACLWSHGWWAGGPVGCEPEAPVPGLPCWCGLTVTARAWPWQPCPMVTCVQVLLPGRGSDAHSRGTCSPAGVTSPPPPHPTWADLGSPRGLPGRASPPEPWRSSHSMSVFLGKARSLCSKMSPPNCPCVPAPNTG